MKILFIISNLDNQGPTNVLFNILKNLDKGFEPLILTYNKEKENSRKFDFIEIGVHVIYAPIKFKLDIISLKNDIKNIVTKYKIDIIHSHCLLFPFINISIPSIHTVHVYPGKQNTLRFGILKGSLLNFICLYSYYLKNTILVACSKSVLNELVQKKIKCNYYVRNGEKIKNTPFKPSSNPKIKTFITASRIDKDKNIEFLVKSFSKDKMLKHNLIILGQGSEKKYLESIATSNVKFYGHVNDVEKFMLNSSAFISSSYSEGLPMAVIEAMSYGLPCILSDINPHIEIKELIGEGVFVFENNKYESLIDSLNILIQYDELSIHRIISNSFNNNLSTTKMVENYQKIYSIFK